MNEIVYVDMSFEAATIARDGSGSVNVDAVSTYSVRWSPYGDRLAITPSPASHFVTSITATDGTGGVTLNPTTPAWAEYMPGGDFSPDQTQFAIGLTTNAVDDPSHEAGIQLFALDGTLGTFIDLGILSTGTLSGGGGSIQTLLWRPGGGFAYIAKDSISGQQIVRTCNADGSGITTILSDSEITAGNDWWGLCDTYANGDLLVIYTPQDSPKGQLIRCAPDGTGRTVLYDDTAGTLIGNYSETGAGLSQDESVIAVACNDNTLRTMPAAGGTLTSIGVAHAFSSLSWMGEAPPPPPILAGVASTGIIRLG